VVDHDKDFLSSIPKDGAPTDKVFLCIYECMVLAQCLPVQDSESIPNTSFTDVNAIDIDTAGKHENSPHSDQTTHL
jgi:hypothetical protein